MSFKHCQIQHLFTELFLTMVNDQQGEIAHEVETARKKIRDWKAHLMRTTHQDAAKSTVLEKLSSSQVSIIMDWAMKFLPVIFRESQSEWFSKKGKS